MRSKTYLVQSLRVNDTLQLCCVQWKDVTFPLHTHSRLEITEHRLNDMLVRSVASGIEYRLDRAELERAMSAGDVSVTSWAKRDEAAA